MNTTPITSSMTAVVLVITAGLSIAPAAGDGDPPKPTQGGISRQRFKSISNAEAWSYLPIAEHGSGQTLPNWALVFARSLPRTTASMLENDRLYRMGSSIGPVLSGKMRLVAAIANRCEYAKAYAEADLRRAGVVDAEIKSLEGLPPGASAPEERAALEFARKMTLDTDTVADADIAYLKSAYGDNKFLAMVLLVAHANFQDRLLLAIDVPIEPGGPPPPLDVRFVKGKKPFIVARRIPPANPLLPPIPERIDDPEWNSVKIDDLHRSLEKQKSKPGRVRVPSWDEVLKTIPPGYPIPKKPIRTNLGLVRMGYQPELAFAWSSCMEAFGDEAKLDRVFEGSLFWIMTRTIHCFY